MSTGPIVHRAVAKVAVGRNPADNFWRPGNMIGAIEIETGQIERVVQGTGADIVVNARHPDTGRTVVGTPIPDWSQFTLLAKDAALLPPGIRTQSWDIAITDWGPVPLEANLYQPAN